MWAMTWRPIAIAAIAAGALLPAASAQPPAAAFRPARPVTWVSVAAGQPARVWAETAAGGWLSTDGGRTFRAPLSTGAFRRAQVAQATLLADGRTLLGMPTVWSTQQFTPPRWSADGGATWKAASLRGRDVHYDFGRKLRFVGESPVTPDPGDPRTAWFCQGNLYVTHDAGRSWAVSKPHFRRPWHCSALAVATGSPHTLILLAQAGRNTKRTPGKLLRSLNGGATWRRLAAPRFPKLDYSGHALVFDPARSSTALMIAAAGHASGALYRSQDSGFSWNRVRPAGSLHGAVVEEIAFTSDGRALAVVRIKGLETLMFSSFDGGLHWSIAPRLVLGTRRPPVYPSPLAASGSVFLLGTTARGFWRLGTDARRWSRP
jgi:photosystem II stability/assembly factor-like uncharacterized protein